MFDGLLFDLDGTLWDSVDAICISWNRALERLAPEYAGTVTRARLLPCMGMLLPDILHRLVPELDQERMKPILEEVLSEENAYVAAHGGTYTREKAMTVFLMVCYKVIDGFADAYEAEFQRDGRLYLTGKSNTFRTLLSVFCFMGSLVTTKDLVFSCVVAVAAQAAGVLLFDFSVIGHISGVDWKVRKHKTWWLFRDNILLFLSVIIDFYVFSASKYAVDANMASRDMSVFGAIFMPTSFINLVAGFVIRPYLTKLSGSWEGRDFRSFMGVIRSLRHYRGTYSVCHRLCMVSGNPCTQHAVPENQLCLKGLPHGTDPDYSGRRRKCLCKPVLLFPDHHAEAALYFHRLCGCGGNGCQHFHSVCARSGNPGRGNVLSDSHGDTGGLLCRHLGSILPGRKEKGKEGPE